MACVVDPRILPGARRAIELHGWQEATLERIAAEAGTSRMTLHRRGITREAILAALATSLEDQYRDALWPALTAPGDRTRPPGAGAGRALRRRRGEPRAHGGARRPAARRDLPRARGRHGLTRATFTEPVERLLRDGAADGSLRALEDPAETATVLFNLIGWTYRHLRPVTAGRPERTTRGVLSIALEGVTSS